MNNISLNKTNKAFTLIEVTLVVGIISLLTGIVISNTTDAKQKAEDVHMITEARQVENALTLYKDKYGVMPTNSYAGEMVSENDSDSDKKTAYEDSMDILVTEGLLPSIPTSPSGTAYAYLVTTDGQSAVFAAKTNKTSSGSGSNSCGVVENQLTFTSCTSLQVGGIECSDYELNDNQSCYTADIYYNYCDCEDDEFFSNNTNIIPTQVCFIASGSKTSCPFITLIGGNDFVCDYTTTDPVCSGASDSDYCTCAE